MLRRLFALIAATSLAQASSDVSLQFFGNHTAPTSSRLNKTEGLWSSNVEAVSKGFVIRYLKFDGDGHKYEPTLLGRTALSGIDWLIHHRDADLNHLDLPNPYGLQISIDASVRDRSCLPDANYGFLVDGILSGMALASAQLDFFETGNGTFAPYECKFATFTVRTAAQTSSSRIDQHAIASTSRHRRRVVSAASIQPSSPLDPGLTTEVVTHNVTAPTNMTMLLGFAAFISDALTATTLWDDPPVFNTWSGKGVLAPGLVQLSFVSPDNSEFDIIRTVEVLRWFTEWQFSQQRGEHIKYAAVKAKWQGNVEFLMALSPSGL